MSVAGVILAAGASTRLGQAKQLVKLASGDTLIENAVRALRGSRCAFRALVLGACRSEIEAATELEGLTVIANDAWRAGMATSIHAAVAWAASLPCTSLLLMVCDQPHVDRVHLDALITELAAGKRMVGSAYRGTVGVPAIFDRCFFDDLASLTGDRGARSLLLRPNAAAIAWPPGAIDIDTPTDLAVSLPSESPSIDVARETTKCAGGLDPPSTGASLAARHR